MTNLTSLLAINIGIDPNVGDIFGLLITWHGVFTAVGIIAGVWLSVSVAATPRINIDVDTAYTVGLVVVFCGIVGARALYVLENYGDSPSVDSVGEIFKITEGGISIYGAIIGGAIGGWAYGLWKKLNCAGGADAAAFGMMLGLPIGRIGDIINGEHFAKTSDAAWAVMYTHPNSPAFYREAMHPAVAYELLGDLVILGVLALLWRLRPKSGVTFCLAFVLYAIMRFFVSELRLDSEEPLWGLTTPQVVSLLTIAVGVPLMAFFIRREEPELPPAVGPQARSRVGISRAERRRRLRTGP
ncbi:MAG TPA: prolipoprotein diacylglyceryl transferase family protein [Dehalococcoidia bacterium]|nr:prolipoprotein diacylglyceryl transferase family protein [Dehalococcoidia bacterium]